MSGKYDDIIHLPRPISVRHVPMSLADRAAQFSPFAALTGYDAAIKETARLTEAPIELDESSKMELNEKLRMLNERSHLQPEVIITYFEPDGRKQGGAYVRCVCRVKRIDGHSRQILLTDGEEIPFDRIVGIDDLLFV